MAVCSFGLLSVFTNEMSFFTSKVDNNNNGLFTVKQSDSIVVFIYSVRFYGIDFTHRLETGRFFGNIITSKLFLLFLSAVPFRGRHSESFASIQLIHLITSKLQHCIFSPYKMSFGYIIGKKNKLINKKSMLSLFVDFRNAVHKLKHIG